MGARWKKPSTPVRARWLARSQALPHSRLPSRASRAVSRSAARSSGRRAIRSATAIASSSWSTTYWSWCALASP
jgi:hypothetical protein